MFWYVLLMILAIVFTIVAVGSLIVFILSGCDFVEILLVTLVAGVIALGTGFGTMSVEKANTTIDTNVVQMEITKCDITSVKSSNGIIQHNCFITVGDKYLVKVSEEEYAGLNVGDIVDIEIINETIFGEAQNPTITLSGYIDI